MKKRILAVLCTLLLFLLCACDPYAGTSGDTGNHGDVTEGPANPGEGDKEPDEGNKDPDEGDKNPDQGDKNPDEGDKNPDEGDKDPDEGDKDPDVGDDYPYEFGDSVSINNDAFYKDYSEEDKTLYYTLWKETTSVSVKVDISPSELYKITEANHSKDPVKQETYRKCDLTITVNGKDYHYDEVGIRMRGNTSRRDFCKEDGLIYAFVHFRFSLNETFDGEEYENGAWASELYHDWSQDEAGRKERKDRSFATMEKFYYKWNKNYDLTYIREIYANRMFQANGILAPHITLTQFSLKQNGNMESLGVGNLYETIDKQFIKRNFDKAHKGGDLYKCTYTTFGPADFSTNSKRGAGIGDGYTYELKTNDDPEDFNHHRDLYHFIDELQKDDETLETTMDSLMDMDYFARFEAVNYLAGNPDCIRNNANNYYIYFTPDGLAYLIPYDYDRCFGITADWDPTGNGMTQVLPYTQRAVCDVYNVLYLKTILRKTASMKYLKLYQSKLREVLDGPWFTYENFSPIYNAYFATYNSLTSASALIYKNCSKNVQFGQLYFSENANVNLSMRDYIERKRKTALNNIDDLYAG